MGKVALLIGVGKYKEMGWLPLPGTQKDIQEMKKVLEHPQIGKFDRVDLLQHPDMRTMQRAIERLLLENRQKDDLVLLYFAGHGFTDEKGRFFFVAHDTERISEQQISTGTAVPAVLLHDYMEQCYAKRQVLILDCCFSGAFAKGMPARGEETIDIAGQLGGEGWAVLTASKATQKTYENARGGVYTQYLVQGIKGAADVNNTGVITVNDLHQYAKYKTQEAKPEMKPEIYPGREGYTIKLANAPQKDLEVEYRKEIERLVKQSYFQEATDRFLPAARTLLDQKRQTFRLSVEATQFIEAKVLQPFHKAYLQNYQLKLQEYEQTLRTTLIESEYPFNEITLNSLKECQELLKLLDKDVQVISARVLPKSRILSQSLKNDSQQIEKTSVPSVEITQISPSKTLPLLKSENYRSEFEELCSECSVDYTLLRALLEEGKWKEADFETARLMLNVGTREKQRFLTEQKVLREVNIQNFPCADFHTIDQLWVSYSNGKFGFSIQGVIWLSVVDRLEEHIKEKLCIEKDNLIRQETQSLGIKDRSNSIGQVLSQELIYYPSIFQKFANEVEWNLHPYDYSSLRFSLNSVKGHLPTVPGYQPKMHQFFSGISKGYFGVGKKMRFFPDKDTQHLSDLTVERPNLPQYGFHYFNTLILRLKSCNIK